MLLLICAPTHYYVNLRVLFSEGQLCVLLKLFFLIGISVEAKVPTSLSCLVDYRKDCFELIPLARESSDGHLVNTYKVMDGQMGAGSYWKGLGY